MKEIAWIKAARKDFEAFPLGARDILLSALVIAANGGKADIAKPLKGFGSGVMELALPYRKDAYRVVYAVRIGESLWVVHAFQKKSTRGISTPRHELDLIEDRLKRLRSMPL